MIPLRLRAETPAGGTPFVVRVRDPLADEGMVIGPFDAVLRDADTTAVNLDTRHGSLRLSDVPAADLAGDVLLVDPARSVAHRLIRARSPHNTFLITERCDQLCVMCSQPPKKNHIDLFAFFTQAALLAPPGITIGISGGEPTLYKEQLFAFLRRALTARPDLRFHILTNGQHFEDADATPLAALPVGKVLWGIPLYAATPALHDDIVGKQGAFMRLADSLALLARCGAAIELRTVLMTVNAQALEALAAFIAAQLPFIAVWAIMQLENIGYGRKNWDRLFFDNGTSFTPVAAAVDAARGRGITAALYNFPLCTVPAHYRSFAHASISDWKRRYLGPCDACQLRAGCGGFFAWYPEDRGFERIGLA
jgi:His-Xaa-Ser system radical SAM maturase HxsC